MQHRPDFQPLDPFPSDWANSLMRFLAVMADNFTLRVKPGAPTVLQVPASANNGQASIAVQGRWRYATANVEANGPGGSARALDVHVTATDNQFTPGSPAEVDSTDYTFHLAITETGAAPSGVALSRKVGTAVWDGAKFTSVTQTAGTTVLGGVPQVSVSEVDATETIVSPTIAYAPTHDQVSGLVAPAAGALALVGGYVEVNVGATSTLTTYLRIDGAAPVGLASPSLAVGDTSGAWQSVFVAGASVGQFSPPDPLAAWPPAVPIGGPGGPLWLPQGVHDIELKFSRGGAGSAQIRRRRLWITVIPLSA